MVRTPNEIDKIIGARLKTARLAAGINQTELAKVIGSSFQQIQKYERGINRISSVALLSFAQILNVPILYFYETLPIGGLTLARQPHDVEIDNAALLKFAASRQGLALLRKFLTVGKPEVRQQVLDLLDSLAKS